MPLDSELQPKEQFPKCVWINLRKGIALNAVGLSNPGSEALLEGSGGRSWQEIRDPFQLSFMSLAQIREEREDEWIKFFASLAKRLPDFKTKEIGIQKNESCPNVGMNSSHTDDVIDEIRSNLDVFRSLGPEVKLIIKLSATFPPQSARFISEHPACWGICVSNTIPWRAKVPWLLDHMQIDWDRLFGKDVRSPLQKRGFKEPGGLSGKPLNDIVCTWIRIARNHDVKCHINGGGGILHPRDVNKVLDAGADSIFLGSMAFLRPWRLQSCIRRAWKLQVKRAIWS